jgi:hypothetical protein
MTKQHMTHEWITDRLPTEADAAAENDVCALCDDGTA